jgi:hypothetical protein
MNQEINNSIKKVIKCERAANNTHWDFEVEIASAPTVFAQRAECGGSQHEDKFRRNLIWKSRVSFLLGKPTNNKFNVRCWDCANFILNELVTNQAVRIRNPEAVAILQQELKNHAPK